MKRGKGRGRVAREGRSHTTDGPAGPEELNAALRAAVDQDAIVKALAGVVQCHRGAAAEIPTEADLIDFLDDCPEADREDAHQRLTALLGAPSLWAAIPLTPPTLAVLQRADEWDTAQWNAAPWGGPADAEVWAYLGDNIATVHARWRELDEDKRADLKQPLLPIVRAWLARPRPVAKRHIISIQDRGDPPLNRAPAVADYALLSPIEAVMVDGEPVVSGGPDAVRWWRRVRPATAPGDQRLLFAGPRKLDGQDVADVMIKACVSMGKWDHRKPLLGDVFRVASLAFGLTSYGPVPEDLGAVFVGGHDTVANRKRWWAAARFLRTLDITINDRTGEFVGLANVDPDGVGGVHLGPPAWWRGKGSMNRWRLSGALWRPARIGHRRGAGGQDELYSGLARMLAGFESRLSYSPTAGRGKHGRVPDALRSVREGRGGDEVFVSWRDSMTFAGEYVAPGADATGVEGRRYRRRIDALVDAGYLVPTSNAAAPAGDTVEIVKVQRGSKGIAAGVRIRASAHYCAAALLSQRRDQWTWLPAARVFEGYRPDSCGNTL